MDLYLQAGDGKKQHTKQLLTVIQSERWEFRYTPSPVQHPSHYWPQYSMCVYGFVIPGGKSALQVYHIICLVLDVSRSSARLRGLQWQGSQAPWAMQTAVLMLLPWCPHSRVWWALQSLLVCQIAKSCLILTEKESCDISARQTLCYRHLS